MTQTRHKLAAGGFIVIGTAALLLVINGALGTQLWGAQQPDEPPNWPDDGYLEPWPLPQDPRPLVEAAGLDLGPMGMAEHYHPRLTISIDGTPVRIPAGIGVDPATGEMSALHTHEPFGELHIEATKAGQHFTLGQVFTQWGVPLATSRVGQFEGKLQVSVNGSTWKGDPAALRLEPKQRIRLDLATHGDK